MQTAQPLDQLVTRTKVEVIGIAEQNAHVQVLGQIALGKSFDGSLCAHWHEDRRLDIAVRRVKHAGAGAGDWTLGLDFEGDLGRVIHFK